MAVVELESPCFVMCFLGGGRGCFFFIVGGSGDGFFVLLVGPGFFLFVGFLVKESV